jgi:hypothetical protein
MLQTIHVAPPKDHQVLQFAAEAGVDERDWRSTAHQVMDVAEEARRESERERECHGETDYVVAGLSSNVIAEHLTGRKAPPTAPVFFAWKSAAPPPQPESSTKEERARACRENVHTESSDYYTQFAGGEKTQRVPPPPDHNILENVTDHPTPVVYESVAHAQMVAAQKASEACHVSGSTSSLLKKDYRKSYAPGYFAWPVPEQFAETTAESHENVHTEYRDSYLENMAASSRAVRVPAPENHNVLGYEEDVDPTVWKSATMSQMSGAEQSTVDNVAGASSAFLAKDSNNLCPPGFFAWPVVPQVAQRSQQKGGDKGGHSEYADNFVGTAQVHQLQAPPIDHDVIVRCLDADQASQWQSVAQSQMEAAREAAAAATHGEGMSLDNANRDYRRSFAPDYFAWPVKNQKAERTVEATANVHTEYRDSFACSSGAGAVRVSAPADHIQLGTSAEELDPANWKSIATLQNEHDDQDLHKNGEDVVFKSQCASSTPSFFVWPKEKQTVSSKKATKSSRSCGYGDAICSEYDSKFVEIDVQNIRTSPVKVTQTIPVNTLDPSVWKSTTKCDMESSLRAGTAASDLQAAVSNLEEALDDKPMNFAWKPPPARKKDLAKEKEKEKEKKEGAGRKGQKLTTEARTSFIDWTPAVQEMHEHHLAEQESNTNTLGSTKRRDVKFAGVSETRSKFQSWSPILPRKADPTTFTSALVGCKTAASDTQISDSIIADSLIREDVKSLISASSSSTISSAASTQKSKENHSLSAKNTADSAMFSTDSLDNRSTATSSSSAASSRKWHTSDDINALRQTSRLGKTPTEECEIVSFVL